MLIQSRLFLPLFLIAVSASCSRSERIELNVELGTRSISKVPFVIAEDQGLYEKYGLDVTLRMPEPSLDGGRRTHSAGLLGRVWRRIWEKLGLLDEWERDVLVDGLTPNIVKKVDNARFPHLVAVAATDCVLRAHIVSRPDIETLAELKGKRIGISARRDTTTGFGALTLAKRMGWDPVLDVSIKYGGRDVEALEEGIVDAIIASEMRYASAVKEGMRVLADTRDWNVALAGNSVMVTKEWLADQNNHEAVRRFVRALGESLALFHSDPELVYDVLRRWHGIEDREIAEIAYNRGQWMPKKPYPCVDGVANTFDLYDSNEMRQFKPEDFYEERFVRELDSDAFFDRIYSQN